MTALATAILDDRDPQLTYAPLHGWSQQHIPEDCRDYSQGEQFIARVTDFARSGTWTTATAETGTANITMEFRGTAVYGFFILFTRVQTVENRDLPPENIANLAFWLNDTRVNPAPLPFEHWWYTDFPQDSIVPNLLMLSQEDLPANTHTLRIEYSIDQSQGPPQVVFAFDRVQYVPVAGFTTNLPPATRSTPSAPYSSSQPISTSSTDPSPSSGRSGGSTTVNTGMIVGISVGIFVFLLLVGGLIVALCWYRRKARRADGNFAQGGKISTNSAPMAQEPHPHNVMPFVSAVPVGQRERAQTTSSFGHSRHSPVSPYYEKSSRPSLPMGAQAPVYPEPDSPQFSDRSGSSPRAAAPVGLGKLAPNRRRLVTAVSDEDALTSTGTPTSGLSYVQHDGGNHARPPSYTSEGR